VCGHGPVFLVLEQLLVGWPGLRSTIIINSRRNQTWEHRSASGSGVDPQGSGRAGEGKSCTGNEWG